MPTFKKTTTKKTPKPKPKPPLPSPLSKIKVETAPAEPPQVLVVPKEKLVTVRPRITEPRCRIGPKWYSFEEGKPIQVTENVAQVLSERKLI